MSDPRDPPRAQHSLTLILDGTAIDGNGNPPAPRFPLEVDIPGSTSLRSRCAKSDGSNGHYSLEGVGLRPRAGPGEENPVRWETDDGIVPDVLTPKLRGKKASVRHEGLGIWAQALSYLDFSLENTIDAVVCYREGIPVRIPAPERFAVHKLIVASARRGTYRAKSEKDLAQANG